MDGVKGLTVEDVDINTKKGRDLRDFADQKSHKYSKSLAPQMVIVAFIDPKNEPSKNVFSEACFENRGLVQVKPEKEGDPTELCMYVLNWEKLNETIHKEADRFIF
jgi:hypothetical protein